MGNLFCCVQVDESTVAFKERFGKFEEELGPGCHFLPWILGYRLAGKLSFRLQQLDVLCQTKTKDNYFISVVASVQFRVFKAIDAFYKLSNVGTSIETHVIHGIGASVPKLNLDDVFEQKNEIAKAIEEELGKVMSDYGYEIVQTLVVDIMPDERVKEAINEINAEDRNMKLQIKRAQRRVVSNHLDELIKTHLMSTRGFAENVTGTTAEVVMDKKNKTQALKEEMQSRALDVVAHCQESNRALKALIADVHAREFNSRS